MRVRTVRLTILLLAAFLGLAACETAEERAQRHFEAGMALLEEGDDRRALVEFRNVFKLDPTHKEARLTYARVSKDQGRMSEAYGQYLRVVEQYPDTTEALIELSEMAFAMRNWAEAERHGRDAAKYAPDDPRVAVITTGLDYAKAQRDNDEVAASAAADKARAMLEDAPGSPILLRVLVDYLTRQGDSESALPTIDAAIEADPRAFDLYEAKLRIFVAAERTEETGETLKTMAERFPNNEDVQRWLIAWYVEQEDLDGAEAFLRELAERPNADPARKAHVVEFLMTTRGTDAARTELDRLIASEPDPTRYEILRATIDYEGGETDAAIAELQELVGEAEPSDAINDGKTVLARMLAASGNAVGARAEVEEVLENDPSHVEALKMRAEWQIEDDQTGDAIISLRTALAQSPRDADVLTLMARAHERAGDRQLAGERYALAVEVTNSAPAETLRYANFLIGDGRRDPARAILTEALRASPDDVDLLRALGTVHIQDKNWNGAQRVIWQLRAQDNDAATGVANALEADMLQRQERVDDTIAFLEGLVDNGDGNLAVVASLVQTQVRAGNVDEATKLLDDRLAESPEDPTLRFLRAGLYLLADDAETAEAEYRKLLAEFPGNDRVLRTLYGLLVSQDRAEDARALLDEQIAANPKALNARLLKAEQLEKANEFDASIAIYEELYAEDSDNIVVANNLASLLATHRDDDASLERAYSVARRLRGAEIPPMQDTYGWIEYRRGNAEEAVKYLEPAAAALKDDPLVQYHLGVALMAVDRTGEAREALQRAIEVGGDAPLPQLDHARTLLDELGTE